MTESTLSTTDIKSGDNVRVVEACELCLANDGGCPIRTLAVVTGIPLEKTFGIKSREGDTITTVDGDTIAIDHERGILWNPAVDDGVPMRIVEITEGGATDDIAKAEAREAIIQEILGRLPYHTEKVKSAFDEIDGDPERIAAVTDKAHNIAEAFAGAMTQGPRSSVDGAIAMVVEACGFEAEPDNVILLSLVVALMLD